MNSREKINRIFNLKGSGSVGFWTGNPHVDTEKMYLEKLNLDHREDFFKYLQDDCRWVTADRAYRHPDNRPMFDTTGGRGRSSLSEAGCFAEAETIEEIEKYPWPSVEYLDFTDVIQEIRSYSDKAVFTGMWSCFFHIVCDYFGMEEYFVKMYTNPKIVEAVTEHVVDFYVEANKRFFEELKDDADIFFFGNDFGSQLDLLISPELFKRFVFPGFKKLINVAKGYDKKVLLHSCGAISRVIPLLIEAGVDAIHPLQAKAAGMDAENLARNFKNDIAFVGGIDTQHLLVHATPEQIKEEVKRVKNVLGPNIVISPSHEAILPNVPLENVIAMAEAARE
jgi:uroporphyrinogen decarboxylase